MLDPRLFVTIKEMPGNTVMMPRPLKNGFNENTAYRVLGCVVTDMTAEYGLWLSNDENMLFLISNRDLRVHHLADVTEDDVFRIKLN